MTEQGDRITDTWASELAEVAAALELAPEAAAGLVDALQAFARDAALAVRSLIGLSLIHGPADRAAVVTALQAGAHPRDIAASLGIPLGGQAAEGRDRCVFVLYADRADAFAELAPTLREALGPTAEVLVDQHLGLPPGTDLSALRHAAVQDMAEGLLIGQGFTQVGATTFLETLTATAGGDRTAAARQVLQSVR